MEKLGRTQGLVELQNPRRPAQEGHCPEAKPRPEESALGGTEGAGGNGPVGHGLCPTHAPPGDKAVAKSNGNE